MSGPTDWILRYIKTTFFFFTGTLWGNGFVMNCDMHAAIPKSSFCGFLIGGSPRVCLYNVCVNLQHSEPRGLCISHFPMLVARVTWPDDGFTTIGLYRDVWIAAIASSRTRLATLSGVMCNTSQCELRSLRVNSGMLNVIRIVTYYTLPPLESPTSSWIAMAYSR